MALTPVSRPSPRIEPLKQHIETCAVLSHAYSIESRPSFLEGQIDIQCFLVSYSQQLRGFKRSFARGAAPQSRPFIGNQALGLQGWHQQLDSARMHYKG